MKPARETTILDRLRAQFSFKLLLTLLLYPAVYGPYFFLQVHHFFAPTELRPGPVDQWVPFSDSFVWIYLSVSLLMPIGPILMNTRSQLVRYAAGIVLISLSADAVFMFHPTICPRPNPIGSGRLYQLLVAVDRPLHGFPSLHAAFALYSGLCAYRMLREFSWHSYANAAVWIWIALILYSTLATKQHMFADIAVGSLLGAGIYFIVFHGRKSFETKAPLPLVARKLLKSPPPLV